MDGYKVWGNHLFQNLRELVKSPQGKEDVISDFLWDAEGSWRPAPNCLPLLSISFRQIDTALKVSSAPSIAVHWEAKRERQPPVSRCLVWW